MDRISLENYTENFLTTLIEPLSAMLDEAKKAKDDAIQCYRSRADDYKKDLNARNKALLKKTEVIEAELAEIDRKNQAALNKLSAALSTSDTAAEAVVADEIDAIAAEEYMVKKKLDTIRKVKITGQDELYEDTLQAFANFLSVRDTYREHAEAVGSIAKILISLLEDVQSKANIGSEGSIGNNADLRSAGRRVWEVIELHNGHIDFTGSRAGHEEDSKLRYAKALALKQVDAAFNSSPAGELLKRDIRNRLLIENAMTDAAQDAPANS